MLQDRGSKLHRIKHPEDRIRETNDAIESSMRSQQRTTEELTAAEPVTISRQETSHEATSDGSLPSVPLYEEAGFAVSQGVEVHEIPENELSTILERIIAIEGPIHSDELCRRVTRLFGLTRSGSRIKKAVQSALKACELAKKVANEGKFYLIANADIVVRDRSQVESSELRKPAFIPPAEIRVAIQQSVAGHLGISPDGAILEVSRMLGFKSTSSKLKSILLTELEYLVDNGSLNIRNGKLYPAN